MKGDHPMPEQPPIPPEAKDFPDHWGFYLLQAINRLDDKIDDVRRDQERSTESLRQEIGGVRQEIHAMDTKFEQKIDTLDTNFEQKIDTLDIKFEQKIDTLDTKFEQKIDTLDTKFEQKINTLDTKFDQKLTALQYWYWGTLVVIIVGFVTILLTHA